jgi:RNA polymerase sigma-70 factor (ECF subfamily)
LLKENETPEDLARQAAAGNEQCFVALCDVLKVRLFRTAKGILGSESLALDAVSETVYRAWRGIRKLREPRYAETWFTRILLNAANDILRRRKHEIVTDKLPEVVHYDNHDDMEIAQLIEALPQELREIISLKYYSGYTLAETAEILDVPEGTVKSRLNRALNLLRLEFSEERGVL